MPLLWRNLPLGVFRESESGTPASRVYQKGSGACGSLSEREATEQEPKQFLRNCELQGRAWQPLFTNSRSTCSQMC